MKNCCCRGIAFGLALAGACLPAAAIRPVGDLPVMSRPAVDLPAAPQTMSGVVTQIRSTDPRGTEIEIGGRWWLVLGGRTALMRDGRPVDVRALAVGQTVRYAAATTTPGEKALGIVHVP